GLLNRKLAIGRSGIGRRTVRVMATPRPRVLERLDLHVVGQVGDEWATSMHAGRIRAIFALREFDGDRARSDRRCPAVSCPRLKSPKPKPHSGPCNLANVHS